MEKESKTGLDKARKYVYRRAHFQQGLCDGYVAEGPSTIVTNTEKQIPKMLKIVRSVKEE